MQFIADELFVGNKLATAEIVSSDGSRVDLRNIRSPIVVFCSKADNITPPQQALDWILDLYDSVDDIRAHGQTIVYAIHESIGHLGIFVSASVAKKEHDEFASNIDLIDVLPPGLYEAVMTPKDRGDASADLIGGDYLVRFEAQNPRRHPGAGRQRRGGRPQVRGGRPRVRNQSRPLSHVRAALGAEPGPMMALPMDAPAASAAAAVRDVLACQSVHAAAAVVGRQTCTKNRQPVREGQCLLASAGADLGLDRDITGCLSRRARPHVGGVFHAIYGSPLVQAMVGLKASDAEPAPTNPARTPRTSLWSPSGSRS